MEHPGCLYASAKREVQRFARACIEAAAARESGGESGSKHAHANSSGSDTAVLIAATASAAAATSTDFESQAARVWNSSRWWPWAAERYLEHVLGKAYWQQFGDADYDVVSRITRRSEKPMPGGNQQFRETRRATARVEMGSRDRRSSETRIFDLLVELEDERSQTTRLRLLTALETEVDRINGAT